MNFKDILYIIYVVGGFIVGAIPSIIAIIQAHKAKKKAKTSEEISAANTDMMNKTKELISEAEKFFKALDISLKSSTGESAGPYKKESVMSKLQAYATEKAYNFDANYWSATIDNIVALTKEVN